MPTRRTSTSPITTSTATATPTCTRGSSPRAAFATRSRTAATTTTAPTSRCRVRAAVRVDCTSRHGTRMTPAYVGGYVQPYLASGNTVDFTGDWANVCYTNTSVTPVQNTTWGKLQSLYR